MVIYGNEGIYGKRFRWREAIIILIALASKSQRSKPEFKAPSKNCVFKKHKRFVI